MRIVNVKADDADAVMLMDELSETLEKITGNSGRHSFNSKDVTTDRSVFAVAYDDNGNPLGCGAIRPYDDETAEVKRMYAKSKGKSVGTEILTYLEQQAKAMGYSRLCLETRVVNERAVSFYKKRGYKVIENYGKYKNHSEAICFEKQL